VKHHPLIIDSHGKITKPFLISAAGLQALGAAMALPIRRQLDYQGLARRVLQVEPLPQGALPYYCDSGEKKLFEFKHKELTINSRGKIQRRVFARKVVFPQFEIYSNPTIKIADIKNPKWELIINSRGKIQKSRSRRRFEVIDRAVQKARQEIMEQEDADIFRRLDDLFEISGNNEE
jgi:hypothetical protein